MFMSKLKLNLKQIFYATLALHLIALTISFGTNYITINLAGDGTKIIAKFSSPSSVGYHSDTIEKTQSLKSIIQTKNIQTSPNLANNLEAHKEMESGLNESSHSHGTVGSAGSGQGLGTRTIKESYLLSVRNKMDQYKRYPIISKRLGQTGTAEIGFRVDHSGEISKVKAVKSSGYAGLDHEAKDILARIGKFDAFPSELELDHLDVVIPVKFELL
jgi:TonB family protein